MKEFWRNNKNKKLYTVTGKCINATNKDDGKVMIKYLNYKGEEFVREEEEFLTKFTKEIFNDSPG